MNRIMGLVVLVVVGVFTFPALSADQGPETEKVTAEKYQPAVAQYKGTDKFVLVLPEIDGYRIPRQVWYRKDNPQKLVYTVGSKTISVNDTDEVMHYGLPKTSPIIDKHGRKALQVEVSYIPFPRGFGSEEEAKIQFANLNLSQGESNIQFAIARGDQQAKITPVFWGCRGRFWGGFQRWGCGWPAWGGGWWGGAAAWAGSFFVNTWVTYVQPVYLVPTYFSPFVMCPGWGW